MSSRSGVLGFTEAELGLFLALIFMGVATYGSGTPTPPETAARVLPADSSRFAIVARLAAERDSLARLTESLGTRALALRTDETRLLARRDSLAALPRSGTSAVQARRTQLNDSITRALDSIRVAREATTSEQRVAANRREQIEGRIEPIVREEAAVMGTVANARRQRDSVLRTAGPADTAVIRRYARLVDSLSAIAGNPSRRAALASGTTTPAGTPSTATSTATAASRTNGTGSTVDRGEGAGNGRGRSNQTPTCVELGVASGDIGTVAIVGPGRFRVRGQEGSIQTVLGAFSKERTSADRAGCRHIVRVTTVPGLAVEAYVPALVDLRRTFNTSLIGPEE